MNFLVSHVTKRPPIKVTQRKHYKDKSALPGSKWVENCIIYCLQKAVHGFLGLLLNCRKVLKLAKSRLNDLWQICIFLGLHGPALTTLPSARLAWRLLLPHSATCPSRSPCPGIGDTNIFLKQKLPTKFLRKIRAGNLSFLVERRKENRPFSFLWNALNSIGHHSMNKGIMWNI